jgi:hypothetical protein
MTDRSAEQAPVETRPQGADSRQDTARIPLAERLQRRIAAADDRRANGSKGSNGSNGQSSARVLPPMPAELAQQQTEERPLRTATPAATPTQAPAAPNDNTAAVPVVPGRQAARRTPGAPARAPRRARLRLSRIDPWSVMKVSFLLSIAFGIVTVVSVFLVWSVLGAAGVWASINNTVSDTVSSGNNVSTFDISDYLGMSRVLGFTMLVSVIDVILITAIATLGAFLYNMAASLLGGIEVTLAEDA